MLYDSTSSSTEITSSAAEGGTNSQASRIVISLGPTCDNATSRPPIFRASATLGEYLDRAIMSYSLSHLARAQSYADANKIALHREDPFGHGMDGTIWRTSRHSVIKVFEHQRNFRDELKSYQRLAAAGIESLLGFAVPELIGFHTKLGVLEISIVAPPFLLDFGKVYFDAPPPYWNDAEVMSHWHAEGQESFGPRWPKVLAFVAALQQYGIWYVDPKPGNIMFGN